MLVVADPAARGRFFFRAVSTQKRQSKAWPLQPLHISRSFLISRCYILTYSMPVNRKNVRLPPEYYRGRHIHFVTICCDHRKPYLRQTNTAQSVLDVLKQSAANHSFQLHAFCIMPDHLHLLAQGTEPTCDLREFIRVLKLRSAFLFKKSHGARLWEMSYYDHTLRRSESVGEIACYIWWNPVRKNLCACPQDFPFSGSQTIEWMQRSKFASSWSAPWNRKAPV